QTTEILILTSFLLTLGLVYYISSQRDAPALIAVVFMSLHSTACGYRLFVSDHIRARQSILREITERKPETYRTIIVRTTSDVILMLYCDGVAFRTLTADKEAEECLKAAVEGCVRMQRKERKRSLALINFCLDPYTIPPLAFVLFANAHLNSQLAIIHVYIILAFLFCSLPPSKSDRREFNLKRQYYHPEATTAHLSKPDLRASEVEPSLARTIWYAIRTTKDTRWEIFGSTQPQPPRWEEWLEEAALNMENPGWAAEAGKKRLVDLNHHVYDEVIDEDQDESSEASEGEEIVSVPVENW
ncbi:hypothetical protein QBC38DRAFT_373278, partial [Podospora fimiseda]